MGNNCLCIKFAENGNELTTDKKEKITNKTIFNQRTPSFGYSLDDSINNYDTISFRVKGGKKNELKLIKNNNKSNDNVRNKKELNNDMNEETIEKQYNNKSGLEKPSFQNHIHNETHTMKKDYSENTKQIVIYEDYSYDLFDEINYFRDDNQKLNNLLDEDKSKIVNLYYPISF